MSPPPPKGLDYKYYIQENAEAPLDVITWNQDFPSPILSKQANHPFLLGAVHVSPYRTLENRGSECLTFPIVFRTGGTLVVPCTSQDVPHSDLQ